MKRFLVSAAIMSSVLSMMAQKVTSPDGKMELSFSIEKGRPTYVLSMEGKTIVAPSHLGYQLKKRER